ncbi:MAG: hypothetical protein IJX37_05700 [Oscillospiraceae bacterium]|nr:hypothetical protein [Oscillospiraceae bacterium]
MGRKQPDITRRLLPAAALVLLMALMLSVGTAWARYRYRETTDMYFAQKEASQVYLWGGIKADGSFSKLPVSLPVGETSREIPFLISNGQSAEDYASYTQQAQVRLLCSLGLGNSGNLSAELIVDGQTYSAAAIPINTGSPVYASFGEGWTYCFLDENGNELRWELAGGQLSTTEMKLQISTASGVESSVLQLMVSAEE